MSLLENLPKEVKREEFSEFLETIKDDFPASEYPSIGFSLSEFRILFVGTTCLFTTLSTFANSKN